MPRRVHALSAILASLLLSALPARADITLIGHYTLVNGDTLTRPSYYQSRRTRFTMPDGNEVIYNASTKEVIMVNHANQRYWQGPRAAADSVLAIVRAERNQAAKITMTPEVQAEWNRVYAAISDSMRFARTGETRKVGTYTCSMYLLTAGSYLRQERWVARALVIPDFADELQSLVIASVADPVGKGLMKLVVQARDVDGITVGGSMQFKTISLKGQTSWMTQRVISGAIPDSAWLPPAGYTRWEPGIAPTEEQK